MEKTKRCAGPNNVCETCGQRLTSRLSYMCPGVLPPTIATILDGQAYYTVIIPYAPAGATQWHPTESYGPLSTLSRGCFATWSDAVEWARGHLNGNPYSVKRVD